MNVYYGAAGIAVVQTQQSVASKHLWGLRSRCTVRRLLIRTGGRMNQQLQTTRAQLPGPKPGRPESCTLSLHFSPGSGIASGRPRWQNSHNIAERVTTQWAAYVSSGCLKMADYWLLLKTFISP